MFAEIFQRQHRRDPASPRFPPHCPMRQCVVLSDAPDVSSVYFPLVRFLPSLSSHLSLTRRCDAAGSFHRQNLTWRGFSDEYGDKLSACVSLSLFQSLSACLWHTYTFPGSTSYFTVRCVTRGDIGAVYRHIWYGLVKRKCFLPVLCLGMLYLLHTARPEMKNQHSWLCSVAALNLHGLSPALPLVPVEDRPDKVQITALAKKQNKKKTTPWLVFWKVIGNWVNQGKNPANQLERTLDFISWKKKKERKKILVRSSTLSLPARSIRVHLRFFSVSFLHVVLVLRSLERLNKGLTV